MAEESRRRRRKRRSTGFAGYYLNPDQFGYTTAQEPTERIAGGEMSTATAGAGGDSGGGTAAGGSS